MALNAMEAFYPLHAYVCERCYLVQLDELVNPTNIFEEYAYFSSYSDSWVAHAKRYCEAMITRLNLQHSSLVAEIASNDGYLLQHFVAAGVPVLGIEPARNVAAVAIEKGIRTETVFFNAETATKVVGKYGPADLIVGNNVLAHVPDINGFVAGLKTFLAEQGVITMEFPHLLRLIEHNQFDTIYHEHFSYLSLSTVCEIFSAHELRIYDVEELSTHGGSIRIYACHDRNARRSNSERLTALLQVEVDATLQQLETYVNFGMKVQATKREILKTLIELKASGKTIAGYGAPGKGNTLLNYCGIGTDFLDFTVDRNPYKQNNYTPGSRIPILEPEYIKTAKPDYLFILPWNLKEEVMVQTSYIRAWNGKWIIPIPTTTIEA